MPDYLILGCGYTASRVARKLIAAGSKVVCTNRKKAEVAGAECIDLNTTNQQSLLDLTPYLSEGMLVLHSIPTAESTATLLNILRPFHPRRFLYLSTAGVYGAKEEVGEHTSAAPEAERDRSRLQTEQLISSGPWSSLVLRPAAIYGPHRGIHTSARHGIFRPPPGGNRIISRIHVDDLADHVLAGLGSEITGAFPVADEEPCTSLEVAEWTASLLGISLNLDEHNGGGHDARNKGRRVNGSAYRRALGLNLRYPSFRQGVPACLAAEDASSDRTTR